MLQINPKNLFENVQLWHPPVMISPKQFVCYHRLMWKNGIITSTAHEGSGAKKTWFQRVSWGWITKQVKHGKHFVLHFMYEKCSINESIDCLHLSLYCMIWNNCKLRSVTCENMLIAGTLVQHGSSLTGWLEQKINSSCSTAALHCHLRRKNTVPHHILHYHCLFIYLFC